MQGQPAVQEAEAQANGLGNSTNIRWKLITIVVVIVVFAGVGVISDSRGALLHWPSARLAAWRSS